MALHKDIDDALAVEEHRQGLPFGGDRDHCPRCEKAYRQIRREEAEAERVKRQLACPHDGEYVEERVFGEEHVTRICVDCGLDLTDRQERSDR